MLNKGEVYVGKVGTSQILFEVAFAYDNDTYSAAHAIRIDNEINNESVVIFNHSNDVVISLFDEGKVREATTKEIMIYAEAVKLYDKFYNETSLRK